MSWEIINKILGRAALDQDFARMLLDDPSTAIHTQGFQLTPEEQRAFNAISARNLTELSQQLIQHLHHDNSEEI